MPHANPMDTGADKQRYREIHRQANIWCKSMLCIFPVESTHGGENVTDILRGLGQNPYERLLDLYLILFAHPKEQIKRRWE